MDKSTLDRKTTSEDYYQRIDAAKYGHKEHLDILVNDPDILVRSFVAQRGFKEHLDILVKDSDWFVRYKVACRGFEDHMNLLVDDDDISVRSEAKKKLQAIKDEKEKLQNIGWLRAIDDALVISHLDIADPNDDYETAKKKLNALIWWNIDVALDPAVNGGWKMVPAESLPKSDAKSRSQRLKDAGFIPRDTRLTCDSCGGLYTPQFLPIHKCKENMDDTREQEEPHDIKSLLEERDRYKNALHQISLASQNSLSSKEECGKIARRSLDMKVSIQR